MFTKFEVPSYEEIKKASENYIGQIQKFWADALKTFLSLWKYFFKITKSK